MAETPGVAMGYKTVDNKLYVQETSRPIGTNIYFTSIGDSTSSTNTLNTTVGGGSRLEVTHRLGDATAQSVYVDFNTMENRTYMHEGYIIWQGADFDRITMGAVPSVTSWTQGTNTDFDLFDGFLIVPAIGTGSISVDLSSAKLVEAIISRDTGKRFAPAYWDATYDATSHTFGPIVPNYAGEGMFNIFGAEVNFVKYANDLTLLNSGFIMLQTADVEEVGFGVRMKLTLDTNMDNGDHAWKAGFILAMNREKCA